MHGSIVGPGVDAAGLYVGLTRGKRVNEAFLVASDDATAERQLVESLRRGDLEATLQDNYRALHRELGISAREGVFAPAAWQQRPAGHLLDLDAAEAQISPRTHTTSYRTSRTTPTGSRTNCGNSARRATTPTQTHAEAKGQRSRRLTLSRSRRMPRACSIVKHRKPPARAAQARRDPR